MYLLDTNVVSELRHSNPHPSLIEWIQQAPVEHLYLSSVTIGEIQSGIEITREQDPVKAGELEDWLDRVLSTYSVLAVDSAAFREWAKLMHHQSDTLLLDAMIAAVAFVHRLTVVTRNVRDFERLGAQVLNPFADRNGS